MATRTAETSPLTRARVAGFFYVVANLPAPFTLLYLPSRFIVRGDAAATAANIMASESLFRFGIVLNLFTRILGILLMIGCFGYTIDSFAAFLGYNVSIIFFTSWGELLFTLWLLIKGVNVEQWKKLASESA